MTMGWLLDRDDRSALILRFPPKWPDVIADHVTFAAPEPMAMPAIASAAICGEADDGEGVQAMVVTINGETARPDGSTWHITWSIDSARGRKPVESNAVIARLGWTEIDPAVPIRLQPGEW